ncbi:MAG TPA: hypothetical protein VMG12_24320, partial [Polyangiaceae bacterium]|nr:hypothetical protein [Polyangiaceae bacterium]
MLVLGLEVACADGTQNVGTTDSTSSGLSNDPEGESYAPGHVSQFVGRWIGEADDALADANGTPLPYRFASGSTRLELNIEFIETPSTT